MNPDLNKLQPYPFEKLAQLKAGIVPPQELSPISLSIGEPRHPTPELISQALIAELPGLARYPQTRGAPELRLAVAEWLTRRFRLPAPGLDPETQVLPVNGTREALFACAQTLVDRGARRPRVLMPNPFYQIYEGAALLAGAEPYFIACRAEQGFIPDFQAVPDEVWADCQLLYICSPGNPSGAVLDLQTLQDLLNKAEKFDFILAADECYSELYRDEDRPPPGLLQAAAELGNTEYRRCLVFHSLSKRSSAPGLRSGFVAGDAEVIKQFLLYRTYHGCAMSPAVQAASFAAWRDEAHVRENRRLYREKFQVFIRELQNIWPLRQPEAGFYLWPETPEPDAEFARRLFAREHVTVLPGSYLSRDVAGENPGFRRVRIALVAEVADCLEAARRLGRFLATL